MVKTRTRKRSRSRRFNLILKPQGAFHPRVQAVGPQHAGIEQACPNPFCYERSSGAILRVRG